MTSSSSLVLYVHVGDDGGLLAIDNESGRSAWVPESGLMHRLSLLREAGGSVLLSHDGRSGLTAPILDAIMSAGIPVVDASEVHPDAERKGGVTALMRAVYGGAGVIAEDLLQRGVDAEAADDDGHTALMYAANGDQDDMVKLLVGAGAVIDQRDHEGSTALMFAAQNGNVGIVKRLLAAHADPSLRRCPDGRSAQDLARENGHIGVASLLRTMQERES